MIGVGIVVSLTLLVGVESLINLTIDYCPTDSLVNLSLFRVVSQFTGPTRMRLALHCRLARAPLFAPNGDDVLTSSEGP